jgi:hypothetical protein
MVLPSISQADILPLLDVMRCGRAGRPPARAFRPDLETTLVRFGEDIIKPYANA